MTIDPFAFWWGVVIAALLGVPLNRWRHDIAARKAAEAHAAASDALVDEQRRHIELLADSHARAAQDWADRCRAANAVAIALDPYERTS